MRKHYFVLVGVALLLAACCLVAWLWPRAEGPVSRARCERVQVGMTLAEVEAVLGGPPGDYRSGEVELNLETLADGFHSVHSSPEVLLGKRRFQHELWQGDDGTFWVCFDEQDRVVTCDRWPGRRVTFLDRVRRWLGV